MIRGTSYVVQVDSDQREEGTHQDFVYSVPFYNEYDTVAVLSATIPKTWYLVDSPRNTFTLTEGGFSVTITVPVGNYSATSFKYVVQNLLNTHSPQGYTYTISFVDPASTTQSATGLYTFTVANNIAQPIITFPDTSTLYKQFGFNYNSANQFVASQIQSINVIDFQLTNAIFIKSDIFSGKDSVLQEIFYQNSFDYSRLSFQNTTLPYSAKLLRSSNVSKFRFTITDTDDNILDLHGHSVNITLCFYKRDRYQELAERNMILKNTIAELRQAKKDLEQQA